MSWRPSKPESSRNFAVTIRMQAVLGWLAASALLYPASGMALDAREIFKLAEPGVVTVLASDAKGEKNNLGSGVIVSPTEIVTSCRVLEAAADIVITQGSALRKATLRFKDTERDLCQVHVDDPLPSGKPTTPAASPVEIEIGQDLHAIGAPRGMDRTMAKTMVSGVRDGGGGKGRLAEIDLPITGGSIGSGVFDRDGRLVGIAAGRFEPGDNSNYVVPAEWIVELPKRGADLIVSAATQKAAQPAVSQSPQAALPSSDAKPGLTPRTGDRWKYRLIDGKRPAGVVSIEIVDSQGKIVRERVTRDDEKSFVVERSVDAVFQPTRFQDVVSSPGGFQLAEISPYSVPGQELGPGRYWKELPVILLLGGYGYGRQKFPAETRVIGREKVRVPAGTFDAVRVRATSQRNLGSDVVKIDYNYWYSPEFMRTVKMSLEVKYSNTAFQLNSESYELISFEPAK